MGFNECPSSTQVISLYTIHSRSFLVNKNGTLLSHCHGLTLKPIPNSLLGATITLMSIVMTTSFTITMTAMLLISSHGVGEVAQHVSPRLSSTIIISNGELNSHLCNMEDVCSRR